MLAKTQVPDLRAAFEKCWPDVEPTLTAASIPDDTAPVRSDRDLLEEILTTVRGLQARPVALQGRSGTRSSALAKLIAGPQASGRAAGRLLQQAVSGQLVADHLTRLLRENSRVVPSGDEPWRFTVFTREQLSGDVVARVQAAVEILDGEVEFFVTADPESTSEDDGSGT
jgi:hypothetical protein